jgi:hypothetical protein
VQQGFGCDGIIGIPVLRFSNALVNSGDVEIAHLNGVVVPAARAAEAVIRALPTGGNADCM